MPCGLGDRKASASRDDAVRVRCLPPTTTRAKAPWHSGKTAGCDGMKHFRSLVPVLMQLSECHRGYLATAAPADEGAPSHELRNAMEVTMLVVLVIALGALALSVVICAFVAPNGPSSGKDGSS